MKRISFVAAVAALALSQPAVAADLFVIEGSVLSGTTPETRRLSFNDAENVFDAARFENLHQYFTSYTGIEQATLGIDFRGLPMTVEFPFAEDPTLFFSVPELHINEQFSGADRDASQKLFSDFIKKNGGSILSRIQRRLVAVSANDPVAGNPNSLMSQMVANDFSNGFSDVGRIDPQNTRNLIGIGVRVTSLRQDGLRNTSVTLPFSYTVRSDIDPRRQLILSAPVTYVEVDGAKAYSVGLGAGYRVPLTDNWTLTPSASYGATGSTELASFSQAVGTSLTSTYLFEGRGFDVVVGNMVGYYKTLKLSASGYSYDPKISNTVFRNGIMLNKPISLTGRPMSMEISLINTHFTGTDLYTDNYSELGVTLGTNKSAASARSFYRAGASYIFSPESKGFTLNLGYWF